MGIGRSAAGPFSARAVPLAVGCLLLAWRAGAAADPPSSTVYGGDRLPLLAPGGPLKADKDGKGGLVRTFRFGAPGVWYLWLRASANGPHAAILTWDLDGVQPLRSGRSRMLIQPHAKSEWHGASMQPEHRASVHVDKPGDHTLRVRLLQGEATIDRIALTLYFSGQPAGDTIDHARDPGAGRAVFPAGDMTVDGYRADRAAPPVKAARTFHVDAAKGDDGAAGTSPAAAWKTFARVNAFEFRPGDALLLARGGEWEEGLAPHGSVTASAWITIGAYGEGPRPRINGVNRHAVHLKDQSWWTLQDLDVTSDPAYRKGGVQVESAEGRPQPKGIRIFNVVAYDNGGAGIIVGPSGDKDNGYDGVRIENCLAFCNGEDGILITGNDQNGCRNGVIRFCTAWENRGAGGIWIKSGQNGLIERCVAYNNVVINIWTWNAINVTMRECETWRGHEADAGGFDIDWSSEACTVERCYAHHNEGIGFLLQGSGWITYRGFPMQSRYCLMRYCVSEWDNPPIGMVETFEFGKVHNNTAVGRGKGRTTLDVSGWPEKPAEWYNDMGGWPSDTEFANNLLVGMDGGVPMDIDDFATRQRNTFDHDAFVLVRSPGPLIRWAGRRSGPNFWLWTNDPARLPSRTFADLAAFRAATGQEPHGLAGDARLPAVGEGGYGRRPLGAYLPPEGSPVRHAGRPVPLSPEWLAARAKYLMDTGAAAWGIPMAPSPVTEDFWGAPVDAARPSIGAAQ